MPIAELTREQLRWLEATDPLRPKTNRGIMTDGNAGVGPLNLTEFLRELSQLGQTDVGQGASMVAISAATSALVGGATDVDGALAMIAGPGGIQTDLIFADATELTIVGTAVTVVQAAHTVDTVGGVAASSPLDTINGFPATGEEVIYLRPESGARSVVLQHGTGNIECPNGRDITLDDADDVVALYYDGTTTNWHVLPGRLENTEKLWSVDRYAWGYIRYTGVTVDQELVTINGRAYEFDTNAVPLDGGGDVDVNVNGGASAAQSATALAAAINGDATRSADAFVMADGTSVGFVGRSLTTNFTLTTTCLNGTVSGATLLNGRPKADENRLAGVHTVIADNVTKWAVGVTEEIPVGSIEDFAGVVPYVSAIHFERVAAGLHDMISPVGLAYRIQEVNTNNYLILLRDPTGVLAAADEIHWTITG